jgi:hypothetical protein
LANIRSARLTQINHLINQQLIYHLTECDYSLRIMFNTKQSGRINVEGPQQFQQSNEIYNKLIYSGECEGGTKPPPPCSNSEAIDSRLVLVRHPLLHSRMPNYHAS